MAENQSKSGFNLPWANLMALLMAVGGFLTLIPSLETSRPPDPGGESMPVFGDQTVASRLWQDPFEEVMKEAKKEKETRKEHGSDALKRSMAWRQTWPDTLKVMIVMMNSGPHAEPRERRLRTRTAVVEGLSASGFTPRDSAHLGYLHLPWPRGSLNLLDSSACHEPPAENYQSIPFEWFERRRTVKFFIPIGSVFDSLVVLYLKEDACRDRPFTRLAYLSKLLELGSGPADGRRKVPTTVLGPATSTVLERMVEELGEFDPADENRLGLNATHQLVRQQLRGMEIFCPTATASAGALVPEAARTGKLANQKWNAERERAEKIEAGEKNLPPVNLTEQERLDAAVRDWAGEMIQRTFKAEGLIFQRTIPTDEAIIAETINELNRRDVDPVMYADPKKMEQSNSDNSVAIISELDSYYGRALPIAFVEQCAGIPFTELRDSGVLNRAPWIHSFHYLRGLDGRLPGDGKKPGDTSGKDGQKRTAVPRPDGHEQTDSLLRLAELLASEDRALRDQGKRGFRAIGVLGSDVYDKLLILRALRPLFPGVVFFTNNLDAQLSHPDEWPAAHNLVVVSAFGLRLHDRWQRNFPPFRDGYQTAMFLGTLVATGEIERDPVPMVSNDQLPRHALSRIMDLPRVFEIGRNGALDLTFNALGGYDEKGDPQKAQVSDKDENGNEIIRIHPLRTDLKRWWSFDVKHSTLLGIWSVPVSLTFGILGVLAFVVIFYWSAIAIHQRFETGGAPSGKSRILAAVATRIATGKDADGYNDRIRRALARAREKLVNDWFSVSSFIASAFAATVAIVAVSIGYSHQWIQGEPFAWFEGLSIWPGVAIRIFAILLAFHFVLKSYVSVLRSDAAIFERFSLGSKREDCATATSQNHSWLHTFAPWTVTLRRDRRPEELDPALPFREGSFDARELWCQYVWRGWWGHRLIRAGTLTLLFLVASWFAVAALDGALGSSPARSTSARAFDIGSCVLLLVAAVFVTLFVVDALCLNTTFIRLFSSEFTRWPEDVLKRSGLVGLLKRGEITEELDVQLIATRTAAIGESVLYPFAIVALLLVSRAPYFDSWRWTTGLIVVLTALLGLAVIAALKLRRTAESARKDALARLSAARNVAGNQEGMEKKGRILDAMIARIANLNEGAFAPFSQQPIIRALLFPAGGLGVWEIARQVLGKF